MNDQFTAMAEDALRLAKKTARNLKLNYVGTEHILMGLILEDGCVASRILLDNGIDESRMMDMIRDLIVPDSNVRTLDRDGFSPRAEKVLEEAHKLAERFHADKTGTEHILLALIKEGENVDLWPAELWLFVTAGLRFGVWRCSVYAGRRFGRNFRLRERERGT